VASFWRFDMLPDPRWPPDVEIMKNANVPRLCWHSRLADVGDECGFKQRVVDYVKTMHLTVEKGRGLLLYGESGTGKTTLACIILRQAMARGPNKAWFEMASDIDFHGLHREVSSPEGYPVWDMLTEALYVVIDDLGVQRQKVGERISFDAGWVERVIRGRYNNQLPTIITTNAPEDVFAIGTGLEAIIREKYDIVEVAGVHWRG